MPDLGSYTVYVLGAYGVSIVLLAGLILLTWRRAVQVRAELDAVEARREARKDA